MAIFGKKDNEVRPPVVQTPAAVKAEPKSSQKDTSLDTTYVGKNLKIKGTISGEGSIIIQGSLEGKFDLKGRLKIAQGAKIKGNVRASDVYVSGNIEGEITASERVQLDNTAKIIGGIVSPKISILEGAMFDGEIKMSDRTVEVARPAAPVPTQPPPASAAPKKKETEL
jgi:cytoskeletal protein CcmA (bactofilin family)